MRGSFPRTAGRIVESDAFTHFIAAVILVNAAALGLETYDQVDREVGSTLDLANDVFLAIFVVAGPALRLLRATASRTCSRTSATRC